MKHTILGAGGSIGNPLAYELLKSKQDVRLVSRKNHFIAGTEFFKADITNYKEAVESVKNSDVVYLCVGLPYDLKVWKDLWPKIMENVIDACKSVTAKLIFFDNVYMYGKVDGMMTEATPYNPCSKKGEIRAKIARMLESEFNRKNINAIIARSADLYGPYAKNSFSYILVIDRIMRGKKIQWMGNPNMLHSFSCTIDCAKGLNLLADSKEAFNQIWHMPTYNPAIDGKTLIEMFAKEMGVASDFSVLKKWMIQMAGLFNKLPHELIEMLYQGEYEYYFDSTKFDNFFHYKPRPYNLGIHETVEFYKKNK